MGMQQNENDDFHNSASKVENGASRSSEIEVFYMEGTSTTGVPDETTLCNYSSLKQQNAL